MPTLPPIAATRCFALPDDIDYAVVTGLSNEARAKLSAARPRTIGQAGRLDGMTPAALTLLAAHVRRKGSRAARRAAQSMSGRRPISERSLRLNSRFT